MTHTNHTPDGAPDATTPLRYELSMEGGIPHMAQRADGAYVRYCAPIDTKDTGAELNDIYPLGKTHLDAPAAAPTGTPEHIASSAILGLMEKLDAIYGALGLLKHERSIDAVLKRIAHIREVAAAPSGAPAHVGFVHCEACGHNNHWSDSPPTVCASCKATLSAPALAEREELEVRRLRHKIEALESMFSGMADALGLVAPCDEPANVYEAVMYLTEPEDDYDDGVAAHPTVASRVLAILTRRAAASSRPTSPTAPYVCRECRGPMEPSAEPVGDYQCATRGCLWYGFPIGPESLVAASPPDEARRADAVRAFAMFLALDQGTVIQREKLPSIANAYLAALAPRAGDYGFSAGLLTAEEHEAVARAAVGQPAPAAPISADLLEAWQALAEYRAENATLRATLAAQSAESENLELSRDRWEAEAESLRARLAQMEERERAIVEAWDAVDKPCFTDNARIAAVTERDFIRDHCRVVYYPPDGAYPIEHTMAARKDSWADITHAARALAASAPPTDTGAANG